MPTQNLLALWHSESEVLAAADVDYLPLIDQQLRGCRIGILAARLPAPDIVVKVQLVGVAMFAGRFFPICRLIQSRERKLLPGW